MRSIPVPGSTVVIDAATLADVLTVLRYVSRGRGNVAINYGYPDEAARRALTALEHKGKT